MIIRITPRSAEALKPEIISAINLQCERHSHHSAGQRKLTVLFRERMWHWYADEGSHRSLHFRNNERVAFCDASLRLSKSALEPCQKMATLGISLEPRGRRLLDSAK